MAENERKENGGGKMSADIIRESYQGYCSIRIQDDMLCHREIECIGEINDDSVNELIRQLRYLEREDPQGEIKILINSPGGLVSSGLALYDVMQIITCPITTVCMGLAASMAAILFVAGDNRQMLEDSRIMIHDPLIGGGGIAGSAVQLDARVKDLMNTRMITAGILAEHTGHRVEEILEKTAADSYFYAKEAIAFGLADRIIKEL